MHHSEITTLSIRDLIPHPSNPRKSKGLTQREVAELTGLRRNQVCRIEQGYYSVGVDILAVLADALGKRIVLEDK